MKTKDHFILGNNLAANYLNSISSVYRKAFILGNIFPDINVFSYLRGTFSHKKISGHSFECSADCIKKLTDNLHNIKKFSISDYFNLGKLIHYTADAFTFAHNNCFYGNLISHIQYEEKLHSEFQKLNEQNKKHAFVFYLNNQDLWTKFSLLHSSYLQGTGSCLWDLKHISMAARMTMDILILSQKKNLVPLRKRAA